MTALPFQEMIEEDVELFFNIRNITKLREQWSEHPMAEIFQDESLLEWFRSLGSGDTFEGEFNGFFGEMDDVFGLSKDEFFELFPGLVILPSGPGALYDFR